MLTPDEWIAFSAVVTMLATVALCVVAWASLRSQSTSARQAADAQRLQADLALLDKRLLQIERLREHVRHYLTSKEVPKVGSRFRHRLDVARFLFGPDVRPHLDALEQDLEDLVATSRKLRVEKAHTIPPAHEGDQAIGVEEAERRELECVIRVEQRFADLLAAAAPHLHVGTRAVGSAAPLEDRFARIGLSARGAHGEAESGRHA